MADEAIAAGVDYCRPEKTGHKGFCLATLENFIKDWPVGENIVMKINPRFPGGRTPLDIGYKYNYRKVLGFIDTEEARSTEPSDTYVSLFPDIYSNVSV